MSEEITEPPQVDGPPPGVLLMAWVRWILIAVMAGVAVRHQPLGWLSGLG